MSSNNVEESLSDPEVVDYLDSEADALADSLGLDNPPQVEAVRLIEIQEWAQTQVECLNEAGFDVTLTEDGEGISYPPLDSSLEKSLNEAIFVCEVKYPVSPRYMQPLSEDQLRLLYDYRVNDLQRCLADEGYDVDVAPPSETVFVENGGKWSPYENLVGSDSEIGGLNKKCPQVPDSLWDSSQ